ncbi:tRNA wybutosine-synthesizing protein 3 homolog isoform X2 [Lagenorhynchus albirostris]|uniref:tRNA wybutosine-synthesizing protein 3 homolog isoform X2 n=1 Tax=Lagenorhynchus albirostris TaxID=27610 RepID=UPI0028E754D7|nr:tRNA wybutosine-synthesizing protein 3 homolog isoform X2 [Lagenorhynchus albirostris]
MDRSAEFRRWKAQCLSKADLSRKGSVDEDVVELVQLLNGREQFFTTSSCAGRIILLDRGINGSDVQKQNCCWLLVTHKPCVKDDVIVALKKANGDAILKFEPLVLHVQCRQLQDAQILAVRSTHGLEVPLTHKGKLMVTEEYINFLIKIANQKMEENKKRIERFYNCLQHALEKETISMTSYPKEKIKEKNNSSYTHKNKRNPGKACGKYITEENNKELENDDHDDPGISVTIFPEDY